MSERRSFSYQVKLLIGDKCTLANFYPLHTLGVSLKTDCICFPLQDVLKVKVEPFLSLFVCVYGCTCTCTHTNTPASEVEMLTWCKHSCMLKATGEDTTHNRQIGESGEIPH